MKRGSYKKKIIAQMQEAGTYKPCFDMTIDDLAFILETRDDAKKQYKASGNNPIIAEYKSRAKEKSLAKNPALIMINELTKTALEYWCCLGLTPKGLRTLGMKIDKKEENSLGGILSDLGI